MRTWTAEEWIDSAVFDGSIYWHEADGDHHIIKHDALPEIETSINFGLRGDDDGSITVDGSGNGDVRREGDGNGDVRRNDTGKGYAIRAGSGNGDAIRNDTGDGGAFHCGTGHGHGVQYGVVC